MATSKRAKPAAASGKKQTARGAARQRAVKPETPPLFEEEIRPDPPTSERVQKLAPIGIQRQPGVAGLIDIRDPVRTRDDLVLSAENIKLLSRLIAEFRHGDQIRRHGLAVGSKILFCGPPGCGKTVTAEVFARELSLPLVTMRLETVISSFLGETASNLAKVFDAVERQPCILFLDEFDAIARTRASAYEHNELRRVVNSLLLLIDRFRGRGFIIAATNLEETLDEALWRRFDEVVSFDRPTIAQIRQLIRVKTRNFAPDFDLVARADEMKGLSFAEVERVCLASVKAAIVRRSKAFTTADYEAALKDEQRRRRIRLRVKNRIEDVET